VYFVLSGTRNLGSINSTVVLQHSHTAAQAELGWIFRRRASQEVFVA